MGLLNLCNEFFGNAFFQMLLAEYDNFNEIYIKNNRLTIVICLHAIMLIMSFSKWHNGRGALL